MSIEDEYYELQELNNPSVDIMLDYVTQLEREQMQLEQTVSHLQRRLCAVTDNIGVQACPMDIVNTILANDEAFSNFARAALNARVDLL